MTKRTGGVLHFKVAFLDTREAVILLAQFNRAGAIRPLAAQLQDGAFGEQKTNRARHKRQSQQMMGGSFVKLIGHKLKQRPSTQVDGRCFRFPARYQEVQT